MSLEPTDGSTPSSPLLPQPTKEKNSTKQADSGGPLLHQNVPSNWVSRFLAFFSFTGFFSNRSAKKAEILNVCNKMRALALGISEKRLKSKLSELDISSLKTLKQVLNLPKQSASSSQIAQSLVQHLDICQLILSTAKTQNNPIDYVVNAFNTLNDNPTSAHRDILKRALKIAQPTTSESKRLQLYKELSRIDPQLLADTGLGQFIHNIVSNSLMPSLMKNLNDLCYGGLTKQAQQTLSEVFQKNPVEAKSLINKLQKICAKLDRTEDLKQHKKLAEELSDAFTLSLFLKDLAIDPTPIYNLNFLLAGRHALTNTQVIDNALARVANIQVTQERQAPIPLYDAQTLFQSSSLQAQISPNTEGDKRKISILVIDSATQASVHLDIPLPQKASGPLSDDELKKFYKCIVNETGMDDLEDMDDDIKALAKSWLSQAMQLYALARKEVQVPTNTRCAKNDKELINSIQSGRIYARKDGQLALTQVQPKTHNEWTVIEPQRIKDLEDHLFAEKTTTPVFESTNITIQTPQGQVDLSLIAKPQQKDHAHFFYVLTSKLPNGQQEISYFLRRDQGTESDSSLFARMREEKFVERHLLMTQAIYIKTQNTNRSKSS